MATQESVIAWYENKTAFLIEKYGPGPRVHYHTGLIEDAEPPEDLGETRRLLYGSQERMLDRASNAWDAKTNLSGRVVDIGCGLGGSCLYFAAKFGAQVTGVTPIPGHVPVVKAFAAKAGLSERVRVELSDAHALHGRQTLDAAYAFGAVNYFNRRVWFERMDEVIRPGGHVCIEDTLFIDPQVAAPFNDYWLSNMGSREEYIAAGEAAGFELVRLDDVTAEAAGFWRLSGHYSRLLLERMQSDSAEADERRRSIVWHKEFHASYVNRRVENLLLQFRKR